MIDKKEIKAKLVEMGTDQVCRCPEKGTCPIKADCIGRCSRLELVEALGAKSEDQSQEVGRLQFNWRQFVNSFEAFLRTDIRNESFYVRKQLAMEALSGFNTFLETYQEFEVFDTLTNPPSIDDASEAGSVLVFLGDTQSWHRCPWKTVASMPAIYPKWCKQPPKPKRSAVELFWEEMVQKKNFNLTGNVTPTPMIQELLQWLKKHPEKLKQL